MKKAQQIDIDMSDGDDKKQEEAGDNTLEKIVEEEEPKDGRQTAPGAKTEAKVESVGKTYPTIAEPRTPMATVLPPKGPETQDFLNSIKPTLDSIKSVTGTVITLTGQDPNTIDISRKNSSGNDVDKSLEDLADEASKVMEKIFKFHATEFEGIEEEEPEENEEEEEKEEPEEEEEEEGEEEGDENSFDPSLKRKENFFWRNKPLLSGYS